MTFAVAQDRVQEQDLDLADRVAESVQRAMPNPRWVDSIVIRAHAGKVDLTGHVRTRATKELAEKWARTVDGVAEVSNTLLVDSDLEIAAAHALAADPRTQDSFPGILVGSEFGDILLHGTVATSAVKAAAEEIAASVPGVHAVQNQLTVEAAAPSS